VASRSVTLIWRENWFDTGRFLTNAVAVTFAVARLDTKPEHVLALSQRSSGRFGGSTTVSPAGNMNGAEVRFVGT
jgi:uncharacterized membrane protein